MLGGVSILIAGSLVYFGCKGYSEIKYKKKKTVYLNDLIKEGALQFIIKVNKLLSGVNTKIGNSEYFSPVSSSNREKYKKYKAVKGYSRKA